MLDRSRGWAGPWGWTGSWGWTGPVAGLHGEVPAVTPCPAGGHRGLSPGDPPAVADRASRAGLGTDGTSLLPVSPSCHSEHRRCGCQWTNPSTSPAAPYTPAQPQPQPQHLRFQEELICALGMDSNTQSAPASLFLFIPLLSCASKGLFLQKGHNVNIPKECQCFFPFPPEASGLSTCHRLPN